MRNIRLIVEYDGASLSGWQRQENGPTVQGHLEDALAKLLDGPTPVLGASRTDAGVHALGQVAAFKTERTIPEHGIRRGLNSYLPSCIAIREATEVDPAFHPRFSATGKHYRYVIHTRPDRSPFFHERAWHYTHELDIDRVRAAAQVLVGEHDFAAFRAAHCDAKSTIRRISEIAVTATPEIVTVDIHGNAFLRNMVRILVGTIVQKDPSQVAEILAGLDRTKAGITAPPFGLTLVAVRYDGTRVSSDSSSR
jgi:tRNA pseudouridine38-40 synthase